MTHLSPTLRAELAKLDDAGIFELLGEIIQPSRKGPVRIESDDLAEAITQALEPAYIAGFASMQAAVEPENDSDDWGSRADYLYEMDRDSERGLLA